MNITHIAIESEGNVNCEWVVTREDGSKFKGISVGQGEIEWEEDDVEEELTRFCEKLWDMMEIEDGDTEIYSAEWKRD